MCVLHSLTSERKKKEKKKEKENSVDGVFLAGVAPDVRPRARNCKVSENTNNNNDDNDNISNKNNNDMIITSKNNHNVITTLRYKKIFKEKKTTIAFINDKNNENVTCILLLPNTVPFTLFFTVTTRARRSVRPDGRRRPGSMRYLKRRSVYLVGHVYP